MMTDDELIAFLGLPRGPLADSIIRNMSSEKRQVYQSMADLEQAVTLWRQGLGPRPPGIMFD